MPRLTVFLLLVFMGFSAVFAQDTVKRKAAAKKYSDNGYLHHSLRYYHRKADSVAHAPVEPQSQPQPQSVKHLNTDSIVPALSKQSLNAQYQFLIDRVYHYQQPLISALWKNASDTLNANKARLNSALARISEQNKTADSLKNEISRQQDELNRRDGMDIFGLVLPKTTYNIVVWGLVALFAVIALVVVGRSGAHRREARHRTQLYSELEEEYKAFKVKANDKEKKLARELQTERNKLDELLGRG